MTSTLEDRVQHGPDRPHKSAEDRLRRLASRNGWYDFRKTRLRRFAERPYELWWDGAAHGGWVCLNALTLAEAEHIVRNISPADADRLDRMNLAPSDIEQQIHQEIAELARLMTLRERLYEPRAQAPDIDKILADNTPRGQR